MIVLMTCLWCIYGFIDTPVDETPASLNHFPEAVSSELICIADWLIMHNRDEYMNVYARVRATMLLKSLQQLKEQQRSSSGGSIQGVPAANSPMVVSFSIYTGTDMSCWNIFISQGRWLRLLSEWMSCRSSLQRLIIFVPTETSSIRLHNTCESLL